MKTYLSEGRFFVAPGIQDMLTAKIADHVGFDFVYGSGFWLTASALGLPDAGIASFTQMQDRMATLVASTKASVIADADTGFGGLLNVHHTVRGFESVGVCAIQIEDQEFPKKCGHTPYKRVIPADEMVRKIKVACDARTSSETVIIARTDARQSEGLDGALRRAEAYEAAGADVLFVEAMQDRDELEKACKSVSVPTVANMASGGLTPILSAAELEAMGYAFAIFPAMTSLVSAAAVEIALRRLATQGVSQSDSQPMFDFMQLCGLLGFDEVWQFEEKWG